MRMRMVLLIETSCGRQFRGEMLPLSSPGGAISTTGKCSIKFNSPVQPLVATSRTNLSPKLLNGRTRRNHLNLTLAKADSGFDSGTGTKQSLAKPPPFAETDTVFVGQEDVPLEGVIQFDKPASSSRIDKWGRVALLAGGDVLVLVLFSAIGRFNHGLPIFDPNTLKTADPFIAGWFLSAYFLGGYAEDGRGVNGLSKAVLAAAKSCALGIPLGLGIRTATSGHLPPYSFALVTMATSGVFLIGWRALLFSIVPNQKKSDVYRQGTPFELFELLTSLVRRW